MRTSTYYFVIFFQYLTWYGLLHSVPIDLYFLLLSPILLSVDKSQIVHAHNTAFIKNNRTRVSLYNDADVHFKYYCHMIQSLKF